VADLKLGPLPKHSTVRIPVVLSEPLKEELDAYTVEYNRQYNESFETAALIPHILETFLRTDRGWCNRLKEQKREQNGRRRVHRQPSEVLTTFEEADEK
jgi:hypothetical protein